MTRENLLAPLHRPPYPINSKESSIYTIPQTGQHISKPLLHQLLSVVGTRNSLMGPLRMITAIIHYTLCVNRLYDLYLTSNIDQLVDKKHIKSFFFLLLPVSFLFFLFIYITSSSSYVISVIVLSCHYD